MILLTTPISRWKIINSLCTKDRFNLPKKFPTSFKNKCIDALRKMKEEKKKKEIYTRSQSSSKVRTFLFPHLTPSRLLKSPRTKVPLIQIVISATGGWDGGQPASDQVLRNRSSSHRSPSRLLSNQRGCSRLSTWWQTNLHCVQSSQEVAAARISIWPPSRRSLSCRCPREIPRNKAEKLVTGGNRRMVEEDGKYRSIKQKQKRRRQKEGGNDSLSADTSGNREVSWLLLSLLRSYNVWKVNNCPWTFGYRLMIDYRC